MTDIYLTQTEADKLIEMKKRSENMDPVEFPDSGGSFQFPLVSFDFREKFVLDIHRSHIDLKKGTKSDTRQTSDRSCKARLRQRTITGILMEKKLAVHTCISIARVSLTSGRTNCQKVNSLISPITGKHFMISCPIVRLISLQNSRGGYSHNQRN